MALDKIGGGGSALARFQQMRDAAQKKLEVPEKPDWAAVIARKQKELGTGASAPAGAGGNAAPAVAARISEERIPPKPVATPDNKSAAAAFGAAAKAASTAAPSAVYGRSGSAKKQDAAPRLGQYVDFLA